MAGGADSGSANRREHGGSIQRARPRGGRVGLGLAFGVLLALAGAVAMPPAGRPAAAATPGRILFVRDGNLWLYAQGAARQLTAGALYRHPSWTADGRSIAVAWRGDYHADIATLGADGRLIRQWTRNTAPWPGATSRWALWPAVAPDGRRIVFASDLDSYDFALWLLDTPTGALRRVAWGGGGHGGAARASWSPDGRRLAVAAGRDGTRQIWVLSLATGVGQQLTSQVGGAYDPAWSPDGSAIAYVAREEGYHNIWMVRPDGSGARRLTRTGLQRAPAWSPDGRRLAYVAHQRQSFDLWTVQIREAPDGFQATDAQQLTSDWGLDAAAGLAWGPDEQP